MNISDSFGTINTPEKEKEKEKIALGLQKRKKNSPWAPEKEKKMVLGGGKLEGTLICKKCWYNDNKKNQRKVQTKT